MWQKLRKKKEKEKEKFGKGKGREGKGRVVAAFLIINSLTSKRERETFIIYGGGGEELIGNTFICRINS